MAYVDPALAAAQRRSSVFDALLQRSMQPHDVRSPLQGLLGVGNTVLAAYLANRGWGDVQSAQTTADQTRADKLKAAAGSTSPVIDALMGDPSTSDIGVEILEKQLGSAPAKPQTVGNDRTGIYALNPDGTKGGLLIPPSTPDWKAQIQDPDYLKFKQAESAAGRAPADYTKVVGDKLVDIRNGKVIGDYSGAGGGSGGLQFQGKSPPADALNWLVANKKLTPEQAANFAAGHLAPSPNGGLDFVTPAGIYKPEDVQALINSAPGAPPSAAPAPGPSGADNQPPAIGGQSPPVASSNPGIIQIRPPGSGQAPAGYRTKADGTGLEPIPGGPAEAVSAGEAGKASLLPGALEDLKSLRAMVINPDGSINRAPMMEANVPLIGAVPFTQGSDLRSKILSAGDTISRIRTGQSANASEQAKNEQMYMPSAGDPAQTVKNKLDRLERELLNAATEFRRGHGDIPPAATAGQEPPAAEALPTLSVEEAAKLPPGSKFIGTDGVQRTRN